MKAYRIEYKLVGSSGWVESFAAYDGKDAREIYIRLPRDGIGVDTNQLIGMVYPRPFIRSKEVDNYPHNI